MRLSSYVIFVDDFPKAGQCLIYHARTQALVKVDRPFKQWLCALEDTAVPPPAPGLSDEQLAALRQTGIVVADEAEDRRKLFDFMQQRKHRSSDASFVATVLTTEDCNFACPYCFEESTRVSRQKLDRPTSDLVIAWLKRKVQSLNVRSLRINYYGGEPLLNQMAIEYISSKLKTWCRASGIGFQMLFQTNGYLLTEECVEKFLPLGLTEAQVSLDGTRPVHDRQRPLRGSGKGTFDRIVQNLAAVAGRIGITVAAGYDKGDPSAVIELLDYLDAQGLLGKLKGFVYSPIHPGLGPRGHADHIVRPGCLSNYQDGALLEAAERIKQVMEAKGLPVESGLGISACSLTSGDNAVAIDSWGRIFKCNAMLGHPELAVGDIREEDYNARHGEFRDADVWKKCDQRCPYLPICNTGCRLFAFFKTQDFTAVNCQKSYMDRFVPEAIKAEYRRQQTQSTIK